MLNPNSIVILPVWLNKWVEWGKFLFSQISWKLNFLRKNNREKIVPHEILYKNIFKIFFRKMNRFLVNGSIKLQHRNTKKNKKIRRKTHFQSTSHVQYTTFLCVYLKMIHSMKNDVRITFVFEIFTKCSYLPYLIHFLSQSDKTAIKFGFRMPKYIGHHLYQVHDTFFCVPV